ncbi:MAG: SRPBCC domain-containing protein, partial [Actinomycetia bacterium]|nr:SRPBCC domain-containing protein [Actinomycetes bacterium]
VFEFLQRQTEIKVLQSDAWAEVREHTAAPPAVVWDHIIDPRKRMQWLDAYGMDVRGATDGRVAPGTEFHCAHGDNELVIFTILDMRPYEYITVIMQFTEDSIVKYTTYLIPSGSGTRILLCAEPPKSLGGEELPEQSGTEYSKAYTELMEGAFAVMTRLADGIVESHAPIG